MKICLLSFFLLLGVAAFCQTKTVDLGNIDGQTARYADITITNTTQRTTYLAKIEHSPQLVYRVSQRYTKPDSSFTIRVQVNPLKEGAFSHVLRVYISDRELPYEIKVEGNVTAIPDYNSLFNSKCPEFEQDNGTKQTEFTIYTVDAQTREVLPGSTLTMIANGDIEQSWKTGMYGSIRKSMEPQFVYFVASYYGYHTTETGIFITPEVENIYIPLTRIEKEKDEKPKPELPLVAEKEEEIPEKDREKVLKEQIAEDRPETPFDQLDFADTSLFRPVNIVFVVDLSTSMRSGDKLNLMKFSLQQFIAELRPEDNAALVTYSKNAKLIVPLTSGSDKYALRNAVSELKPESGSSGSKGVKMGYEQFDRKWHQDALNMVIVVTDGKFDNPADYQRIVSKKQDLATFSVVAVKASYDDGISMKKTVESGNGAFIEVKKLADAQENLLKAIRLAAYRK